MHTEIYENIYICSSYISAPCASCSVYLEHHSKYSKKKTNFVTRLSVQETVI